MPKVITLAHQKGGVGKSTLCLNLAYSLCKEARVVVVDYDVQGTLIQLKPIIEGFEVVSSEGFKNTLDRGEVDFLIVDTPPYLAHNLLPLFIQSDLVVVPTKVGYADLMAIRGTIDLIKKAQEKNKKLRTSVILNMVKHRTSLTDEIKSEIDSFGVTIFATSITDRVSYIRSLIGKGIGDSEDGRAIDEVDSFANEVIDLLYPNNV